MNRKGILKEIEEHCGEIWIKRILKMVKKRKNHEKADWCKSGQPIPTMKYFIARAGYSNGNVKYREIIYNPKTKKIDYID